MACLLRDDPVEKLLRERRTGHRQVQLMGELDAQAQILVEHPARVRSEQTGRLEREADGTRAEEDR